MKINLILLVRNKSFAKTIHYIGGEQKVSLSNVAEILSQCRIAFITFSTVLFWDGTAQMTGGTRWGDGSLLLIIKKVTSQLQLQFLSTNNNCLMIISLVAQFQSQATERLQTILCLWDCQWTISSFQNLQIQTSGTFQYHSIFHFLLSWKLNWTVGCWNVEVFQIQTLEVNMLPSLVPEPN